MTVALTHAMLSTMNAARKLEPVALPAVKDVEPTADPLQDEEIAKEWEAEIERRAEDIRSGRVQGIPWEQVEAEISAKYGWD